MTKQRILHSVFPGLHHWQATAIFGTEHIGATTLHVELFVCECDARKWEITEEAIIQHIYEAAGFR